MGVVIAVEGPGQGGHARMWDVGFVEEAGQCEDGCFRDLLSGEGSYTAPEGLGEQKESQKVAWRTRTTLS